MSTNQQTRPNVNDHPKANSIWSGVLYGAVIGVVVGILAVALKGRLDDFGAIIRTASNMGLLLAVAGALATLLRNFMSGAQ